MCGIAGVFSQKVIIPTLTRKAVQAMTHRGPDGTGFFQNEECNLGMCRLAIIDVESGHQPNFSLDKQTVSVFNGEIYNFRELREELQKRGRKIPHLGDSALIPFLYEEYGEDFPKKLQGMFAIAVYDKNRKKLLLARDRIGKKPLWISYQNGEMYFASELKALLEMGIRKSIKLDSIPEFLRFGYINAPRSAFEGINQLAPATILILQGGEVETREYWNSSDVSPISITFDEAKSETLRLLRQAVKSRLISERPVGAFLSGGIDSTIISALMHQESESEVHTFSVGFLNPKFDESKYADEVARAIGTKHHKRVIQADPKFLIERLAISLDHPFADSSIIPSFALSEFARKDVVVALSGDGGDEVFGGYERYRAGVFLNAVNPMLILNPLPLIFKKELTNSRIRKLIRHSSKKEIPGRYQDFQSLFQTRDLANLLNPDFGFEVLDPNFGKIWNSLQGKSLLRKMQEMDLKSYLPGDLMYKVDISSMANSLEVRSPFLDYRVVEFGLSLPNRFKITLGENKHILREIAKSLVPPHLIDRPKMGFGIPRAQWLRYEFRELTRQVLLDGQSRSRGWYRFGEVEKILKRHAAGEDLDHLIWPMFILELWAKNWIDS